MLISFWTSTVYHILDACFLGSIIHPLQKAQLMTTTQQILTILIMSLAVVLTRFLPFLVFSSKDHTPRFVQFLGRDLASAVFGMLVIYCLKDIDFHSPHHIVLKLLAIIVCILLHLWRRNMLLTIAGGTIFYMILLQCL